MKTLTRWLIKTHRLLGALMSILFVTWFASGLVIIYKKYPKYTPNEYYAHLQPLSKSNLPSTDSIAQILTKAQADTLQLEELILQGAEQGSQQAQLHLTPHDSKALHLDLAGDSLQPQEVNKAYLDHVAGRWGQTIERIDTIADLDQWTPFSRLRPDLPFYRLLLSGGQGHEVYVSSTTGKVLQESTRAERIWSWLGAIPHWIYFTSLRQDVDAWRVVVIVLGSIGSVMAISGFLIGIHYYRIRQKRRKLGQFYSPFPKRRYYWHHFMGTIGGVLIITWILSGVGSMISFDKDYRSPYRVDLLRGYPLALSEYRTDIHQALETYPQTKTISYSSFANIPIIRLNTGDQQICLDGRDSLAHTLSLDSTTIITGVKNVFTDSFDYSFEWLTEYDGDYVDHNQKLVLPVARVRVSTPEGHSLYIDPKTGNCKIVDYVVRKNAWRFDKFHRLDFAFLANRPILWTITMWFFMIIGLITSGTGLWLTFDYIRRYLRKRKR